MRRIERWMTVLAVGLTTALAGCATAPPPPPFPSPAEMIEIQQEQDRQRWESMYPGREVPVIGIDQTVTLAELGDRVNDCVNAAQVPKSTTEGFSAPEALQRTIWVCESRYPVVDPTLFMLSEAQLDWLYDYFSERFTPCMTRLGYQLDLPDKVSFMESSIGYPSWFPHESGFTPMPTTQQQRDLIDRECPLPSMVSHIRM